MTDPCSSLYEIRLISFSFFSEFAVITPVKYTICLANGITMDTPGPSNAPQRGEKRRSAGTTLAEKALKYIAIDGERAICAIDPGSGCTYIQRKLDVNNFVRHFRTRHAERADVEGLVKETDPGREKPRHVAKRQVAIDKRLLVEVAIKLVSFHNLPVSCFEWEGMRQLFEPLLAAVGMALDTRILKRHVDLAAGLIKEAITAEMKGILVSLKIDSASRHNRHVLAVLVRYAADGVIVSRTLGKCLNPPPDTHYRKQAHPHYFIIFSHMHYT